MNKSCPRRNTCSYLKQFIWDGEEDIDLKHWGDPLKVSTLAVLCDNVVVNNTNYNPNIFACMQLF